MNKYQAAAEAKNLASAVSNFVNVFGGDNETFVKTLANDHPTLQQGITRLVIRFLRAMAAKEYVDDRNRAAVNAARVMVNALNEARAGGLPLI